MNEVTNQDDLIDVRDVIARVEHLRQLRVPGPVDLGADDNEQDQDDLFAELASLEKLLSDLAGDVGDEQFEGNWYPISLIRDSYFDKSFVQSEAEDMGLIDENATWPNNCIDWEQALREFKMD